MTLVLAMELIARKGAVSKRQRKKRLRRHTHTAYGRVNIIDSWAVVNLMTVRYYSRLSGLPSSGLPPVSDQGSTSGTMPKDMYVRRQKVRAP